MNNIKTLRDQFTAEELEALRKYIEDVKAWSAEEPPQITDEEKITILQYMQEHNGEVPPEYDERIIIGYYYPICKESDIDNIPAFEPGSIIEHYNDEIAKTNPLPFEEESYHCVISDVVYENWYKKIYDIAPAKTLFKLIDLINKTKYNAREVDLLHAYIPEDEDNRQRLEAAIKDLLGADLIGENTDFDKLPFFPNASIINLVIKSFANPGNMKSGRNNVLNGQISIDEYADSLKITRKTAEEEQIIKIANLGSDFFGKKQGKAYCSYNKQNGNTIKLFCYFLQRYSITPENYNVFISYKELVTVGMYKTIDGARRGLNNFYDYMHRGSATDNTPAKEGVSISGVYKIGRRKILQSENDLIIGRTKVENGMFININPNIDMNIFTSSFTFLPTWVYSLETMNAFSLARYIFSRARQSGSIMRDPDAKDQNPKHPYKVFKISFDSIRDILGLPNAADVKGRKYKERIKDPIEKAIDEIETLIDSIADPEKTLLMRLTPSIDISACNIGDFLKGYLEIGILSEFSDKFIGIAHKREKHIEDHRRKVEKERARIEAKKTTELGAL